MGNIRKQEKTRREIASNDLSDSVPGPDGRRLTRDDLPSPTTKRWVARRKAEVVAAVCGGLISLHEALRTYNLSVDEFRSWQRLFESHGLDGLRTTRIKTYRDRPVAHALARTTPI